MKKTLVFSEVMYWINFLHIYQPIDQSKEILKKVVNESYRPLFKGFLNIKNIKINLNINGSLTELLAREGYNDVIMAIKKLAETGRLEFTESAKYHALLPYLKKSDIVRQIEKNQNTNKKYFGKAYKPVCFFPPEMAYNKKVARVISRLGYKMILVDEISYNGGKTDAPKNHLFFIKDTNLLVVFRERRVSNCIMSAVIRNAKEFRDLIKEEIDKPVYMCTAMDGETFGHHRPGLEKFLFKILQSKKPKQIFLSELPRYLPISSKTIDPLPCTWASCQEDIEKGIQFYSWFNPKNKIHRLQWRFLRYVLKLAKNKKLSPSQQEKIDRIMASDKFFWASGEPWWSIEMIEKGAWAMLRALKSLPGIKKQEIKRGYEYYKEIIASVFWWQRSGKVESLAKKYREAIKIPFKEKTIGKGEPWVYTAFIQMLRKKMWEAARKQEFEKAILWRDAIWKLETKNDIYDAIHVIDLLRAEMPHPEVEKIIKKYEKKYKKIKPGQPEMRRVIH